MGYLCGENEISSVRTTWQGKQEESGKVIDSILKELAMTRKKFNEVNGIAMEMKASEQSKVLAATPIVVARPSKGVTIAQPCA